MIERFNHKLIEYKKCESSHYEHIIEYIVYICIKCNCYILKTEKYDDSDDENNYWMYFDGKFREPNTEKDVKWYFLTLTCEEEVIKRLLE